MPAMETIISEITQGYPKLNRKLFDDVQLIGSETYPTHQFYEKSYWFEQEFLLTGTLYKTYLILLINWNRNQPESTIGVYIFDHDGTILKNRDQYLLHQKIFMERYGMYSCEGPHLNKPHMKDITVVEKYFKWIDQDTGDLTK